MRVVWFAPCHFPSNPISASHEAQSFATTMLELEPCWMDRAVQVPQRILVLQEDILQGWYKKIMEILGTYCWGWSNLQQKIWVSFRDFPLNSRCSVWVFGLGIEWSSREEGREWMSETAKFTPFDGELTRGHWLNRIFTQFFYPSSNYHPNSCFATTSHDTCFFLEGCTTAYLADVWRINTSLLHICIPLLRVGVLYPLSLTTQLIWQDSSGPRNCWIWENSTTSQSCQSWVFLISACVCCCGWSFPSYTCIWIYIYIYICTRSWFQISFYKIHPYLGRW